jgi:hypothetical protein
MSSYKSILGMDKLPSYYGFSLVVIDESGIAVRKDVISIEDVAEVARSNRVDAVAMDNIYELGSEVDIRRFTTMLYKTELIQVTGSPLDGFRPLAVIAKELGMGSGEKLSPARSAEVCARAVIAGRGYLVKVFEPETKITISRRRKFGTGGMSEGRYRRSIQGSVLNLTNTIKSDLVSRGIDFDLAFRKGSHGIEGSSFVVYASRNRLFGIVRPLRTSSINVRIMPSFTRSFGFTPLGSDEKGPPKRYLVVGVDPGMVTGLAVMDLNGRALLITSGRAITRGQITRTLAQLGRALVFSTDVNPAPDALSKLAASHSAILFTPEKSLKSAEKKEVAERISREQGVRVEDSHQRDSLAAAMKAFSFYRNKLEQAASHARKEDRTVQIDEVKANVLRGMSISDAIEASRAPVFEEAVSRKRAVSEGEQIRVLKSKLEDIRTQRDALLSKVNDLGGKMEDMANDLRLARLEMKPKRPQEFQIYELERRIRSLQGENFHLRASLEKSQNELLRARSSMELLSSGRYILLRVYKGVSEVVHDPSREGDVAFVETIGPLPETVLKELRALQPTSLVAERVSPEEKAQFLGMGIPVIFPSSLSYESFGSLRVVDRASLTRSLEEAKKELQDFSSAKASKLKDLFEEYRKERAKEPQ